MPHEKGTLHAEATGEGTTKLVTGAWLVGGTLILGNAPAPAWAGTPIPLGIQIPLDRVTSRLLQAPFEANGSGPGGIRRRVQNAPRDTVIALYRDPSSMPEVVQWTREQVDSGNDNVGIKIKQELFERGKDNIKIRIEIKKSCKSNIQNIESVLKELDNERNPAETVKQYKHRFLNAISILDRLQLEWQKYDLCFKH